MSEKLREALERLDDEVRSMVIDANDPLDSAICEVLAAGKDHLAREQDAGERCHHPWCPESGCATPREQDAGTNEGLDCPAHCFRGRIDGDDCYHPDCPWDDDAPEAHEAAVRSAAVLEAQEALAWWDSGRRPMRALSAETVRALLATPVDPPTGEAHEGTVREQGAGKVVAITDVGEAMGRAGIDMEKAIRVFQILRAAPEREQDAGEREPDAWLVEVESDEEPGRFYRPVDLRPFVHKANAESHARGWSVRWYDGRSEPGVRPTRVVPLYAAPTDSEGEDG